MEKLKVAIQKSGRLSDKSLEMFAKAGINISNGSRLLFAESGNFPVEILFLRDDDIPQYVEDGVADVGIVGENVLIEKKNPLQIIERLGFAKCRISLAVPRDARYNGLEWFLQKKIATSYPVILQKFLDEKAIQAEIHVISGSVEICPGIGLADAIFDIVSTGSTLISNGLTEVEKVLNSEAVLISGSKLSAAKQHILEQLVFRIKAIKKAESNKYILLNAPKSNIDKIIQAIPGMKSPTIVPLADPDWVSVHSVVEESKFWEIIYELKQAGAQGILVVPIEKMII